MSADHRCAHPGCDVHVPGYQLACQAHWFALPAPLRKRINLAWNRARRRPGDEEATSAHLALVVEAMQAWA